MKAEIPPAPPAPFHPVTGVQPIMAAYARPVFDHIAPTPEIDLKVVPSDGRRGNTPPLAVESNYDFHELGTYLGNVGPLCGDYRHTINVRESSGRIDARKTNAILAMKPLLGLCAAAHVIIIWEATCADPERRLILSCQ